MTKWKLFSAVVLAAATLTAPAIARGSFVGTGRTTPNADAKAAPAEGSTQEHGCPAPRVGAFATAPWTNETPCEPNTGF